MTTTMPVPHTDDAPAPHGWGGVVRQRAVVAAVKRGRTARARRRVLVGIIMSGVLVLLIAVSLMVGNTFYDLGKVIRVILGDVVPGASFAVGELRLPRSVTAVLTGFAFGLAGVTFQTVLRNPLASPDIIGVSAGASAAAVSGIVFAGLRGSTLSMLALAGALATAATIYLLANRGGFAGARLILIGIGVAAILNSIVTYALSRAASWDLQTAMQWTSGSVNGAAWGDVAPLVLACAVVVPVLLSQGRTLSLLGLGDDSAAALGVAVRGSRILLIAAAVVLVAFATAASGPIAFVAFMAGPVAARLMGAGGSLLLPAGLVGANLVLAADLVAQFAFENRYPVGVVTGVLGAPYLIYLLVHTQRSGGGL